MKRGVCEWLLSAVVAAPGLNSRPRVCPWVFED